MGTSGNPSKKAQQLKVSQVGDFKKRLNGVFELPSGLVVKLRNPGGMQGLIKAKLIPNSLMGIIQKSIKSGSGVDADVVSDAITQDDNFLQEMTEALDAIAVACLVEPKVHPVPETEDDRSDELLYADELPDDDKMFIFQWVSGGVSDLETFRQRHAQNMASLASVSGSEDSAK